MSERKTITDVGELEKFFNMTDDKRDKIRGIRDRFKMPTPEDKNGLTVRLIGAETEQGIGLIERNITDKFTTHVTRAEEISAPGIIKDIPVGPSVFNSYVRAQMDNGFSTINELVGKVVTITSSYWTAAPRDKRAKNPDRPTAADLCPECKGKGCVKCTVTGQKKDAGVVTGLRTPVVFSCTVRNDLMGAGVTKPSMSVAIEF